MKLIIIYSEIKCNTKPFIMRKNRNIVIFLSLFLFSLVSIQCKNEKQNQNDHPLKKEAAIAEHTKIPVKIYGTMPDGTKIKEYTLQNGNGMEVKVITYGGRITSLKVPDREGNLENVVLGLDTLEEYLEDNPFFGAIIGRYGNRIAEGKFSIGEQQYTLAQNDGKNHLHGGNKGFDKVVWKASEIGKNSLLLNYVSKDMEEGYPGNLEVAVTYTLSEDNELKVDYQAKTDKTTVINLTQHSYFNLSGDFSSTILDHQLELNADVFLPVDQTLIPTGELRTVEGSPFDFRESKRIGKDIDQQNEQLKYGAGYDHCWVLHKDSEGELSHAATLYDQDSGRLLKIATTEPGIQFYAGNLIDEGLSIPGTDGKQTYPKRSGLCLETQHYPDSPNQDNFPSVVLRPGVPFSSQTIFSFSVK